MNNFNKILEEEIRKNNGNLDEAIKSCIKTIVTEGINSLLKSKLTNSLGYEKYGDAKDNYRNGYYKSTITTS